MPSKASPAIDATAARARFAAAWAALGVPPEARWGLAVSGGPDSLALLWLAAGTIPGVVAVATADHGLRPDSTAEAAAVAFAAATVGWPHHTLPLALNPGTAMPERARDARYAALASWARDVGLAGVVTAHHADDQAETLLMRLNRGAGLRGLAGMRSVAPLPGDPNLLLLRPLLGWHKAELVGLATATGWPVADDPTNRDARFERARARQALAAADWLDPAGIAASAAHLAEADLALDWVAAQILDSCPLAGDRLTWADHAPTMPDALALRVLGAILGRFGSAPPRGPELVRWLATLRHGGCATLGGVQGDARHGPWHFTRTAPHRPRA